MLTLTKADILKGKEAVRSVEVKALGGEINIRPLTDGEWSEVNAIFSGAIWLDMKAKTPPKKPNQVKPSKPEDLYEVLPRIDMGAYTTAEYEAHCLAAAYGLSCNGASWNKGEIKSLKPGSAEEIANLVFEFSGVALGQEALLASFRKK